MDGPRDWVVGAFPVHIARETCWSVFPFPWSTLLSLYPQSSTCRLVEWGSEGWCAQERVALGGSEATLVPLKPTGTFSLRWDVELFVLPSLSMESQVS